ncbi:Rhodanese domain protein [Pseudopedobacter saltans DSM 12145]|uniref:Rhodanese domain protein n=1 Tax=Pseudopedobacter saltans (strain ATCC 51119 / DSM 12145 / JCM 21818 / CCUG 39354 / LMG 10337 / NBRC 100064 / NCIMB 13643) TaxID=762903 RepID=F0S5C3_PSESL|nr:rhodanese-like domain-containing protein [Pseudopedobacter saltans]ADY52068.1 Rhodanese domain protein [Pseudopedobacter saltans DSM 12145]
MAHLILSIFFAFSAYISPQNNEEEDYDVFLKENIKGDAPFVSVDSLKTTNSTVFLDAREKQEFDISHIRGARNIGYIWFDMRNIYDIPKSAHIVIYCTIGNRSEKIGSKLIKAGYQNVHVLYGGLIKWINEGLALYRNDGAQTTEIHTYNEQWAKWTRRGAIVF